MKIEWDVEVSKIVAENIVVAELSEENQHSFVRFYFRELVFFNNNHNQLI